MLHHALCSALVDIRARSMNLTLLIFYYLIRIFPFIMCLLARTLVWNDACVVMSCVKTVCVESILVRPAFLCKTDQRSKGQIYNTCS